MKCDFQSGDKIACVTNFMPPDMGWHKGAALPAIGDVYTVAAVLPGVDTINGYEVAVLLAELHGQCSDCGMPLVYPHGWFRKVEKRSTDSGMKILIDALADVKAGKYRKEPVDA